MYTDSGRSFRKGRGAGPGAVRSIILTVVILGFLSSCGRYGRETESNDSPANANRIVPGRTFRGTLDNPEDADFYLIQSGNGKLEGYEGDLIFDIRVACGQDTALKIFREDRLIKAIDDRHGDGDGQEERIVNVQFDSAEVARGAAFFCIAPSDRSTHTEDARYTVHVEMEKREGNVEGEPNDKKVQAVDFGEESMLHGWFNPSANVLSEEGGRETDWYTFTVEDGGGPELVHISLSGVPGIDSNLAVFDEFGYTIRKTDPYRSGGPGRGEKLMSLGLQAGRYYIRVSNAEEGRQNPEVGYMLKIAREKTENAEMEPNDRYSQANACKIGSDMRGYFNPVGDSDWYRINEYSTDIQVLSIKMGPVEDLDPVIEFHFPSARESLIIDDRGVDEGEILKNIGISAGVWYFRLYSNSDTGDTEPYTLLVERKEWTEDWELELNNTIKNANTLEFGGLKRGYISPAGDEDCYGFYVKTPAGTHEDYVRIPVIMEVSPCFLLDFSVELYNENGESLIRINENPQDEAERVTIDLEPGLYYARVKSENGRENSRDTYLFRAYPEKGP